MGVDWKTVLWFVFSMQLYLVSANRHVICKGLACTRRTQRRAPTHVSVNYQPSNLETIWTNNARRWDSSKEYCSRVLQFKNNITFWLNVTERWTPPSHLKSAQYDRGGVFSVFEKVYACNGQQQRVISWIEPLAFALRYPTAPCPDKTKLLSREYMLLMSGAELRQLSCGGPRPRKFYFDLGASTWSSGLGGASQKWLVEAYARRGIHFHRLLLWEATPHTPEEIFSEVPVKVLHGYQYINVPVTTNMSDPSNPLNILKTITQPGDFVVLKIDIDNSEVEAQLINQLLIDPELYSRVDEFFFEHHVNFELMLKAGWGTGLYSKEEKLHNSYKLFQTLRKMGIRAHGWP